MKLLIDTVNEDFFIALINDGKTISFIHYPNLKKKSDELPDSIIKLLSDAEVGVNELDSIYVVNGPGSFMGVRAGMTYAKTLALAANKNLFGISNTKFISNGEDGKFYIDAKSSFSYFGIVENGRLIEEGICPFKDSSKVNYDLLINSPNIFLDMFSKVEDIVNYESNYIKEPNIGGSK